MPVLNRQGKMLSIYEFLTSASAFVIAIMLATTTILPESGLAKLRRARNILVPSYFVPYLTAALKLTLQGMPTGVSFYPVPSTFFRMFVALFRKKMYLCG